MRNRLRDVNVSCIAVVSKGANRKRWFLRKEDEKAAGQLVVSPAPHRLVKTKDWSAVYCVVAEPEWEENPGVGAEDQSVPDVWDSPDEIRKACHRFAKRGLITKLHESLEPYGELVENAIAQTDFTVVDPDGQPQTIVKDSWYIAIEPSEEGRRAIEAGEFTGVSIEGEGVRELEKAAATTGYLCSNCGHFMVRETARDRGACPGCKNRFRNAPVGHLAKAADLPVAVAKDAILVPNKPGVTNWIERAGGLPKYIADIAGDLISERGKSVGNAIQMAIGIVRNWARGQGNVSAKTRAKAAAAVASYNAKRAKARIAKGEGEPDAELAGEAEALAADPELIAKADAGASAANSGSLDSMAQDSAVKRFLKAIGKQVGASEDDLAILDEVADLEKAQATFAERMAQRDFEDELPDAFSVLRDAIWSAFYPQPDESRSPQALIEQSLDEFKGWALDLLGDAGSSSSEAVEKIAGQVAADVDFREATATLLDGALELPVAKLDEADQVIAWTVEEAEDPERAELVKAERTFSAEDRRKKAKKGVALPDGSYPIPDEDALRRAMRAVGRAPKDKRAKVKAHIRRRAKALGATSLLTEAFAKHLATAYRAAGRDVPDDLAKIASIEDPGSLDSEMGLTEEERAELDGLKKTVDELPETLSDSVAEAVKKAVEEANASGEGGSDGGEGKADDGDDGDGPTAADLKKSFDDFVAKTDDALGEIAQGIEKLGDGSSSQDGDPAPDPGKSQKVRKSFERRELDPDLAGVL